MTESKHLTAEDIIQTNDLELLEVNVPEWGGSIYLRVLPGDEGLEVNEKMQALPKEKQTESIFMILAACIVDKQGRRIFQTDEHFAKLRTRSHKVLLRLQKQAIALQGWSQEAPAKNA